MKIVLALFLSVILSGCFSENVDNQELETKYPDTATMGAAADAGKTPGFYTEKQEK